MCFPMSKAQNTQQNGNYSKSAWKSSQCNK